MEENKSKSDIQLVECGVFKMPQGSGSYRGSNKTKWFYL